MKKPRLDIQIDEASEYVVAQSKKVLKKKSEICTQMLCEDRGKALGVMLLQTKDTEEAGKARGWRKQEGPSPAACRRSRAPGCQSLDFGLPASRMQENTFLLF